MATTIAKLNIHLGANAGQVTTVFASAGGVVAQFGARVNSLASQVQGLVAAYAGLQSVRFGVTATADAETAATAFRVMLGSAEAAKTMLQEIRDFAASSPQTNVGLRDAAQLLMNYGLAANDVMPTLRLLTDISGSNEEKMRLLSLAYGQANAAGRLMGQDLLQMINAGFNPLQEISRRTGETMIELRRRMEAGGIAIGEVRQAFVDATSEGGRFFRSAAEQSQTLAGRYSTLKDNVELLALKYGTMLLPVMKQFVELGVSVVGGLQAMDVSTIKQAVSVAASVAAFAAFVRFAPPIVAAIQTIIASYRALSLAQILMTAVTNPMGLAVIAGGLAVAAASAMVVNEAFDAMNRGMETTAKTAAKAAEATESTTAAFDDMRAASASAVAEMANGGSALMDGMKDAAQDAAAEVDAVNRKYDTMVDRLRNRGTTGAVERFTREAFEAVANANEQALVEKQIALLRQEQAAKLDKIAAEQRRTTDAVKANKLRAREVNI